MRSPFVAVLAIGSLLLVGCGSDDSGDSASDAPSTTGATTAPSTTGATTEDDAGSDASAIVSTSETDVGEALVGPDGLTLYGFTNDGDGVPTCVEACADNWPPLTVDSAELPAGLDPAVFSVVERPDGEFQLKAGDWPLYFFAADSSPGDVNGQGSGGVWFVAAPDGTLIGADE